MGPRSVNRPDVRVTPERVEDHIAIRQVVRDAFAHHQRVADLVELIRASPQYRPELSLVAKLDHQVVGHVMLSHTDLVEADGTRHRVLTLSPLSVAPAVQGNGIGGRLVLDVVARADALGEPLVVLEGSPAYYTRFGFVPAVQHGISIELPSWAPPEAAMVRPLAAYRHEVKGHVDYPPYFAAVSQD